jgi:hypothetical protein
MEQITAEFRGVFDASDASQLALLRPMTDNPKSVGQIRFAGGTCDGMKVPWGDEPLAQHLALKKTPQGLSVAPTSRGEHVYDLASEEGRTDLPLHWTG